MAQQHPIDQLNKLIQINRDAEASFRTASENIKNSELETLFAGYAKQHAGFETELQEEIRRLDGNFSDSGTAERAAHRGWMGLKAILSGHSAAAILSSCESGEESAEIAYADAADANPSGKTHTLIDKHLQQIKGFRIHLARLVGGTKDGVDFQKNE